MNVAAALNNLSAITNPPISTWAIPKELQQLQLKYLLNFHCYTGFVLPENISFSHQPNGRDCLSFLAANGQTEKSFALDIPASETFLVRGGHVVSIVYISNKRIKAQYPVAYYNHTTQEYIVQTDNIEQLTQMPLSTYLRQTAHKCMNDKSMGFMTIFVAPIAMGIAASAGILLIPVILRQRRRRAALTRHAEKMISLLSEWDYRPH